MKIESNYVLAFAFLTIKSLTIIKLKPSSFLINKRFRVCPQEEGMPPIFRDRKQGLMKEFAPYDH